ncbi:MAG: LytTR family DNA-binding domain-containing protein [Hydrogenothermaceae bacterium]|nr:LytTR family DNA-binding domain-containing protein [Hydrogenothermaceae bacterium]
MKAFIVEDEYISRERLKRILTNLSVKIEGEVDSKEQAIEKLFYLKPDVVFLDIRLPDGTGLEIASYILQNFEEPPYIVFVTAHGEYALEAFKVNSIDYVLKPYKEEDIKKSLEKINSLENKKVALTGVANLVSKSEEIFIPVKYLNKYILLKPSDIYYIKAELSETIIRTKDHEYLSNKRLYEFEQVLSNKGFFRVHKSYIINLAKVKEMKVVEQSKFLISFEGIQDAIKTSRDGAKLLREFLDV